MGFENATISLDKFVLERPIVNVRTVMGWLKKHYGQEVLRQAYKIFGAVDFLGNPVGVFQIVTSGLDEFVAELAVGNLHSGGLVGRQYQCFAFTHSTCTYTELRPEDHTRRR